MAKTTQHDASGMIDAICNVHPDQAEAIDELIVDLARQLAVATAVQAALAGNNARPEPTPQPTTAATRPIKQRPAPSRTGQARPTAKAIEVARCILANGALTKDAIADRLGWKRHAVAMTLGRSKQHFTRREDGTYVVGPGLSAEIEQ